LLTNKYKVHGRKENISCLYITIPRENNGWKKASRPVEYIAIQYPLTDSRCKNVL
jgi:hypothetical protein